VRFKILQGFFHEPSESRAPGNAATFTRLLDIRDGNKFIESRAPGNAATFSRLLDINDENKYCSSFLDRLYLARFAECVSEQLNNERRCIDVKIKTRVYAKIMGEAYPHLENKSGEEWKQKYHAQEIGIQRESAG